MCAGQQADFCVQRADFIDAAAVNTFAVVQQPTAYHELLHLVHDEANGSSAPLLKIFRFDFLLNRQKTLVADVFIVGIHCIFELIQELFFDSVKQVVVEVHALELFLGFANFGNDGVDKADDAFALFVCNINGFQHRIFVNFVCASLNHNDLFHAGCNSQLKLADFALCFGRIDDNLAVNKAHEQTRNGAFPGNVRDRKRDRSADDACDLGAAVLVNTHNGHNNRNIVAHIFREEGANGAVDHTRGQNRFFTGAAFAAHKAAGDAANCVQFFFKIYRKGEEINTVAGFFAHGNVAKHCSLAVAHHAAAVGKAAHFARFNNKRTTGDLSFPLAEIGECFFAGSKFLCHNGLPPVFCFTRGILF